MQILYAAPFLVLAAVSFFVCASIPRLRTYALVIPVGFLTFGVGALIAYFIFALIMEKFGYKGPATWFYLIPYVAGGLLTAVVCTTAYKGVVAVLPLWIIRTGLLIGSICSALVLGSVINIASISYIPSAKPLWAWSVIALITLYVTASVVCHAALFRPQPLHWFLQRIFKPSTADSSQSSI
jgi:hypothetical protein